MRERFFFHSRRMPRRTCVRRGIRYKNAEKNTFFTLCARADICALFQKSFLPTKMSMGTSNRSARFLRFKDWVHCSRFPTCLRSLAKQAIDRQDRPVLKNTVFCNRLNCPQILFSWHKYSRFYRRSGQKQVFL